MATQKAMELLFAFQADATPVSTIKLLAVMN